MLCYQDRGYKVCWYTPDEVDPSKGCHSCILKENIRNLPLDDYLRKKDKMFKMFSAEDIYKHSGEIAYFAEISESNK